MFGQEVESRGYQIVILVSVLASLVSVAMVAIRIAYADEVTYAFLIWNLFLAWVPMGFSLLAYRAYRRSARVTLGVVLYSLAWLIFFPNAPYIVTDFLHLQARAPVPHWFDLLLLLSFAWAGLFLGFNSLYMLQRLVIERRGRVVGWLFAFAALGLSSFGIYLGRFLGWNSWDVLTDPRGLAAVVLSRLAHPLTHFQTYAVSLLLTVVFTTIYVTMFSLTRLARPVKVEGKG